VSIHLVASALKTPLKGAHKLVFLGLCESARDDVGRLSWPGIEALIEAGSVSRPRVFAILKDLQEQGWIVQTGRGQKHRRAVYQVFPGGCCEHHGSVSGSTTVDADESASQRLVCKTLKNSQGLVLDSQGLVLDVSASRTQDPFLKALPSTSLLLRPKVTTAGSTPEQAAKNRTGILRTRAVLNQLAEKKASA